MCKKSSKPRPAPTAAGVLLCDGMPSRKNAYFRFGDQIACFNGGLILTASTSAAVHRELIVAPASEHVRSDVLLSGAKRTLLDAWEI